MLHKQPGCQLSECLDGHEKLSVKLLGFSQYHLLTFWYTIVKDTGIRVAKTFSGVPGLKVTHKMCGVISARNAVPQTMLSKR
jgi:hypothetical protein